MRGNIKGATEPRMGFNKSVGYLLKVLCLYWTRSDKLFVYGCSWQLLFNPCYSTPFGVGFVCSKGATDFIGGYSN
jgi:hypothetical protein